MTTWTRTLVLLMLAGCAKMAPSDVLDTPRPPIAARAPLPSVHAEKKVPNADAIVRCAVRRATHVERTRLKMGRDSTVWVDVAIVRPDLDEPERVSVDSWWRKTPHARGKMRGATWEPIVGGDSQGALDRALARVWGGDPKRERCAP